MTTGHLTDQRDVGIYHAQAPTGPFPEQPPSAPLTPVEIQETGVVARLKRELTDPRALWKNARLGGHAAVFGLAVFLYRQFGWWLKTM